MKTIRIYVVLLLVLGVLSACRAQRSEKPPIHLNPNMDVQSKFRPQQLSLTPPTGVIVYGGKPDESKPALTTELMKRGQQRYDIYCSVCHDRTGSGKGMVVQRGFIIPPDFHSDRIRAYDDQGLYNVITKGIRNMPSYAKQIPPKDRWAIVYYVRALQRSGHASLSDIPESMRGSIQGGL